MKRVLRSLTWLITVIIVLSACSSGTGNSGASPSGTNDSEASPTGTVQEEAKNVKLTFSFWGNDNHKQTLTDIAAKFTEQNPGITVEFMNIPFNDYQQKLSIMLASRTAPDLGWLSDTMIPQFLESGQLLDVSAVKEDASYNFDDLFPATLEPLTKDGQLHGIPFSTPPTMIFYNKTLFQQKGLKTPTELYKEGNWTYEEMRKAALALTDPAQGIYGVKLVREWKTWSSAVYSIVRAYGANVLSKDGTMFELNSPEGRQAIQLYYDMIFKDEVHPKPGDQLTFESGKLAMFRDVYSSVTNARAITDFEWDVAPMPSGPNGSGNWIGFAGYTVFKDTKHPEEAMAFLKFVSNEQSMSSTSKFFVPSRKSVLQSDAFMKAGELPTQEGIQTAVLDQMGTVEGLPLHKNWQKIDTKMQTLFDYLYTQSASVEDVLASMEEEVTPLLE